MPGAMQDPGFTSGPALEEGATGGTTDGGGGADGPTAARSHRAGPATCTELLLLEVLHDTFGFSWVLVKFLLKIPTCLSSAVGRRE